MRDLLSLVLFTLILLAARGGCRPNRKDSDLDYAADVEYSDGWEDSDGLDQNEANREEEPESPSHILSQSQKIDVRVGGTVTLPCDVSHSENVVVIWNKGSKILFSDNTSFIDSPKLVNRITRQPDNTLVIANFGKNDTRDYYTCSITSSPPEKIVYSLRVYEDRHPATVPANVDFPVSSITDQPKTLQVLPNPHIVVDHPNTNVTLRCVATWEPKPKVRWIHGDKRLASDPTPADGSSLTVRNVTASSAGLYQCLAEGEGEKPVHAAIHILVPHAPRIEVNRQIVHTGIKMESELTCRVYAYPQANVTWYKNGQQTDVKEKVDLSTKTVRQHTVVFGKTERSDLGNYSCHATNGLGNDQRFITLTGVPTEARFESGRVAEDGITPVLEWTVESFAPITEYRLEYRRKEEKTWKTASPKVTDDGTSNVFVVRYPIEGLQPGSYEAVLLARNEFGWSPRPVTAWQFTGDYVTEELELANKSGAAATQSLVLWRTLLLVASLYVYATYV